MDEPPSDEASPRQRVLTALALLVAAMFALAVGLGWSEPSRDVPRWLVGLVGLVFGAGAIVVMLPASSRTRAVITALMMTGFTGVFAWIAFGPGERAFSVSWSFAGSGDGGDASEWLGRAAFGFGALLSVLITTLMWRRVLRGPDPTAKE